MQDRRLMQLRDDNYALVLCAWHMLWWYQPNLIQFKDFLWPVKHQRVCCHRMTSISSTQLWSTILSSQPSDSWNCTALELLSCLNNEIYWLSFQLITVYLSHWYAPTVWHCWDLLVYFCALSGKTCLLCSNGCQPILQCPSSLGYTAKTHCQLNAGTPRILNCQSLSNGHYFTFPTDQYYFKLI